MDMDMHMGSQADLLGVLAPCSTVGPVRPHLAMGPAGLRLRLRLLLLLFLGRLELCPSRIALRATRAARPHLLPVRGVPLAHLLQLLCSLPPGLLGSLLLFALAALALVLVVVLRTRGANARRRIVTQTR